MWWTLCAGAFAASLPPDASNIDLRGDLKLFETDAPKDAIDLPGNAQGDATRMTLAATGAGPVYRWAVADLENPEKSPARLVVSLAHQGFAGSGLFWPLPNGSRVLNAVISNGSTAKPLRGVGGDAFAIDLAPGERVTVAFELPVAAEVPETRLWQPDAFDAMNVSQAFFRGLVVGIALFMTLAMAALFVVRRNSAFPSAALFGAAATAFIALDAGHGYAFSGILPRASPATIRGIVEGLMLTGALLCLITFTELRRRMPVGGNLMALFAALSLALPVYAWFEPGQAAGLARLGFAIAAGVGLVLILALWRRGYSRAEASLLAWFLLVLWTIFAGFALFAAENDALYKALVAAGLVVVLVSMAFTMAQFAFSQGFLSRRFSEEAGRRALALSGGRHFVWDWRPETSELLVGEEMERALDIARGTLGQSGVAGFLDLIHPLDRKAYTSAVESAEWRGRGSFTQDFRLRHGDGGFRWFRLQASAMPGGSEGRAQRCVGTLTDVTGDKRSEERLLRDAVYDRVTGLPNRALLTDRIERAIAETNLGKLSDVHLLLIDLDRFKTVNDAMGHESGDALLNVTGRRLVSLAGPEDTVARLPGDQFAVLFVGSEPKREITAFVDQLRKSVARPVALDSGDVFLTASLGIAKPRERTATADDLMRDAAVALYEAKRGGKDTFEFFNATMTDDRSELFARETDLRRALERGEIEVHYQPIARLRSLELAGFEALARWRHPGRGLLGPDQFIAIAETTGLIRDIGRYVLAEAARQFGVWQRAFRPHDPLFCAVNMAASQIATPGIAEEVKAIVAREAIVPGTFKIEVTESAMMENPELAGKVLERMKSAGIGLACDDFGTGYSSFSTLRQMPFDTLKIDRSLATHELGDERAAVILDAVIRMGHDLGLAIVAEGIASDEQVQRLAAMGCDLGQGFFIGPPMSARQVSEALSVVPYDSDRDRNVVEALRERAAAPDTPPVPPRRSDPLPTLSPIPPPTPVNRDAPPPPPFEPPKALSPIASLKPATVATITVLPANGQAKPAEQPARPIIGAAPMAPRVARADPPLPEPSKPAPKKRKVRRKPRKKPPEVKVPDSSEG